LQEFGKLFGKNLDSEHFMQKPELKTVCGIVIAAAWNEIGDVVSVAIADYGEEKYLVADNEAGRKLLSLLRKRVVVDGIVKKQDAVQVIDIKEIRLD